MVKVKDHIEFLGQCNSLHPKITVLGTYSGCNSKIEVKCNTCNLVWAPTAYSLLSGHGCGRCAGVRQKTHEEFVEELKCKRDDVIIFGRYEKALRKTTFKFLKCGHHWDITPSHILRGRKCPQCSHSRREPPSA